MAKIDIGLDRIPPAKVIVSYDEEKKLRQLDDVVDITTENGEYLGKHRILDALEVVVAPLSTDEEAISKSDKIKFKYFIANFD